MKERNLATEVVMLTVGRVRSMMRSNGWLTAFCNPAASAAAPANTNLGKINKNIKTISNEWFCGWVPFVCCCVLRPMFGALSMLSVSNLRP